MSHLFRLDEPFSHWGKWWRPDNYDQRHHGKLSCAPGEQLLLETENVFENDHVHHENEVIHGKSNRDEDITLFHVQGPFSRDNDARKDLNEYHCNYFIRGTHAASLDALKFRLVYIHITDLEEWLSWRLFQAERGNRDNEIVVTSKRPDETEYRIDAIESELQVRYSFMPPFASRWTIRAEYQAFLILQPDEPRTFEWFLTQVESLKQFFSLVTGGAVYVRQLGGELPIESEEELDRLHATVGIYFHQKNIKEPPNRRRSSMALAAGNPHFDEGKALSLWFEDQRRLRTVRDLFFSNFFVPSYFVEQEFLTLMQAIETFFGATEDGVYLADGVFDEIKRRLLPILTDADLPQGFRASAEKRVGFLNSFSLKKKMKVLLRQLSDPVPKIVTRNFKDVNEFLKRVCDTRDYLTHYATTQQDKAMPITDIARSTWNLKAMLIGLMLHRLDVRPMRIADAIGSHM